MGYLFGSLLVLLVALVCGFISLNINEQKGHKGGFFWGFLLGVIGIIVVAVRADKIQKVSEQYTDQNTVTSNLSDLPGAMNRIDHEFDERWGTLLKYDEDVKNAVESLRHYGPKADVELKKAFKAIGEISKLPGIVSTIQDEFEKEILLKLKGGQEETKKNICPKCFWFIKDSSNVCSRCGADLVIKEIEKNQTAIIYEKCDFGFILELKDRKKAQLRTDGMSERILGFFKNPQWEEVIGEELTVQVELNSDVVTIVREYSVEKIQD